MFDVMVNSIFDTDATAYSSPTSSNYSNAPTILGSAESSPTLRFPSGSRFGGCILLDNYIGQAGLGVFYHEIRKIREYWV